MKKNLFKFIFLFVCLLICNVMFSQSVASDYSSPYTISIKSATVLPQIGGDHFLKLEVSIKNNMSKTLEFSSPTPNNFRLTILKDGKVCILNKDEDLYYFQNRKNIHVKPNQSILINLSYNLKGLTLDGKAYPSGEYQVQVGYSPIAPLSVTPQESNPVSFEIL